MRRRWGEKNKDVEEEKGGRVEDEKGRGEKEGEDEKGKDKKVEIRYDDEEEEVYKSGRRVVYC